MRARGGSSTPGHLTVTGSNRPSKAVAGRIGLRNLGNTCFMNAGLQCLSHIEPLTVFFLSGQFRGEINRSNDLGSRGEFASAFADLQRTLWQSGPISQDPSELHARLTQLAPQLFEDRAQQDVQEFLAFCLDGLHEDLNNVVSRRLPLTEQDDLEEDQITEQRGEEFSAALSWLRHLERNMSFMVDLMQGQLRSTLECMQCGHSSRRFDPFLYLSLPVTGRMTQVLDALTKFLEEEMLVGDEQWHCDKCNQKVNAMKKIDLWKLPPVLVLHLKRFEFCSHTGEFKKIDTLLLHL